MRRALFILPVAVLVAGCGVFGTRPPAAPAPAAPGASTPPPPRSARTAEAFDTTSAAERRAAASTAPAAGERRLGTAIASLGDPAAPGFWMETPFVSRVTRGRVVLAATGASAQVELRPAGEGGGNRLSLAAMRLLGADLAGLPEVVVYGG